MHQQDAESEDTMAADADAAAAVNDLAAQGNLLKGIVILLVAARFVVQKTTSFSNIFSLFQLETKTTFYKQCWPYMVSI